MPIAMMSAGAILDAYTKLDSAEARRLRDMMTGFDYAKQKQSAAGKKAAVTKSAPKPAAAAAGGSSQG